MDMTKFCLWRQGDNAKGGDGLAFNNLLPIQSRHGKGRAIAWANIMALSGFPFVKAAHGDYAALLLIGVVP